MVLDIAVASDIIMYTVEDISNIFKCSVRLAYDIVNLDGFPSMKLGGRILVEKNALNEWIGKNKGKLVPISQNITCKFPV